MISDYEVVAKEAAGTLDKPRDMFRSPDIREIGIHLDVPKGLVVDNAAGAAAAGGMLAGDIIVEIENVPVLTFGDFLHVYDQLDRSSTELSLAVERRARSGVQPVQATRVELELELPRLWWAHDLKYRRWSVDPVTDFDSEPLTAERKSELGLEARGFACEVTKVRHWASVLGMHSPRGGRRRRLGERRRDRPARDELRSLHSTARPRRRVDHAGHHSERGAHRHPAEHTT